MSCDTLETRAVAQALAELAGRHPKEFDRLYAKAAHPQNADVLEEEPLLDAAGRVLEPGLRVRRPDGVLGEVKRLNKPRRAAVVVGDDGSERFVMAHRLRVTSRKRELVTADAA